MGGLITSLLSRRRRGQAGDAPDQPSAPPATMTGDAKHLADRLDRAERLGLRSHARRLADQASAYVADHPGLAERVARLRLADGCAERALDVIETCRSWTDSLRLLRIACLLMSGRRIDGHTELIRWARSAGAPIDARRLLAILEWEDGRSRAASEQLLDNVSKFEDVDSMLLLLLLALEEGRIEQAQTWARRLSRRRTRSDLVPTDLVLAGLGLDPNRDGAPPVPSIVRALATELVAAEPAIEALVEAHRLEPDRVGAELLAAAIELALPDLDDDGSAMIALARLHLLLDDPQLARTWIDRAAAVRPMDASLALLERDLARAQHPELIQSVHRRAREAA